MPSRIEVGRYGGLRGAKEVASEYEDAVSVDCRVLVDPVKQHRRGGSAKPLKPLKLEDVKKVLTTEQERETAELVERVVEGVLDGKVVCVRCRMGKHRSQAVAAIAAEELRFHHPDVQFEGPVLLGGIKKTA